MLKPLRGLRQRSSLYQWIKSIQVYLFPLAVGVGLGLRTLARIQLEQANRVFSGKHLDARVKDVFQVYLPIVNLQRRHQA